MTDIIIPPEAVEAAATEIFKVRLAERPYPHSPRLIEWLIDVSREEATAALRAGIAAWPGAEWRESGHYPNGIGGPDATVMKRIILPLLTETTNAEG